MSCLASAKFSMLATVLKSISSPEANDGSWKYVQNPDSGAIERQWVDTSSLSPEVDSSEIACRVSQVSLSGLSSFNQSESFGSLYESSDFLMMKFPKDRVVTQRDRITNIRPKRGGAVIWSDEEIEGSPPSIFDVVGVQPVLGPTGRHVENMALLRKTT